MNRLFVAIAALMASAVLVFSSCGGGSKSLDLTGVWNLTSVDGVELIVPEEQPSIEFVSDNEYHIETGINIVNGNYSLNGNTLSLSDGPMTRRAGSPEGMLLEQQILDFVFNPLDVKVENGVLTLTSENGLTMSFTKK